MCVKFARTGEAYSYFGTPSVPSASFPLNLGRGAVRRALGLGYAPSAYSDVEFAYWLIAKANAEGEVRRNKPGWGRVRDDLRHS
jgi:hypothetical protein